ncbi:MAG: hypothetical protein GY811_30225 [Myxococcales bacterium]|nr:hypothetical protein [Myxococcales bacterium]
MRALCMVLLMLSCGGTPRPATVLIPTRPATSGDALLGLAPAGADLILELDLARLRENAAVGKVLESMSPPAGAGEIANGDLLAQANSLLVCVYGVGDLARQLVLVDALEGVVLAGAAEVGQGRYAVGDVELVAQAVALGGANGESMLKDEELLRLRALVMPEEADHGTLRGAARLDFDARVSVSSRVGMSEVPVSLAVWGDVVDDLAIVAHITGEHADSHESLSRALLALRDRVAKTPLVRYLGLTQALSATRLSRSGATVQIVFVLSPKRLIFSVDRLVRQLQSVQPSVSHD